MNPHGNSKKNEKGHHLYAIYDKEENDVFKYGISYKPIGKDGYSSRMRRQVDFFNSAVGWLRYFAEILLRGIAGRTEARRIEDEHIDAYKKKHDRNPRGNKEKNKSA
jgi:URI fold toxin 2